MYALIYDEQDLAKRDIRVLSVHRTRKAAEKELEKRQHELQRRVWDCNARVVWVTGKVRAGESIQPGAFSTWRPGERIPEGDLYSDTD